ncbi:hypothetical protein [uncultured Desulfobacter sp.]|uniref:hypothetical protein n=1 Tax=uncultured Desulfobacter sp. TaxID=240139 RepID=UPI002AAB2A98|nr:hypothetical protein [uncultured Desulfobacter sp.]
MKKIIVALAAVALMAGSAYAADWNFYGSARVQTFWSDVDVIDGADGDVQYSETLHSNARIGANVKVSDELTGRFEYGASGGNANIRLLYGEWNFGAGKLLVGQDYAPLNYLYSNQVGGEDFNLLSVGGVYAGRQAQVCVKFGGFKLAVLNPRTQTTGTATVDQVVIPAIQAAYALNLDMLGLEFGGGYSSFDTSAGDVDSYVLTMGAKLDIAGFFMKGDVYYGENAGNFISMDLDGSIGQYNQAGFADASGTEVLDNECIGFMVLAGFKINDMVTIEAGYGFAQAELDNANSNDQVASYYINTTITFAPGVFIVPEVGYVDGQEAGDLETLYYGLKWQINF